MYWFRANRSFIDSRTFDGFRKSLYEEYSDCYIVDTRSDVRANPKIAGTTHNVFGIQTGVAIMFLVKKEKKEGNCRIHYVTMDDYWRKEEKLQWLKNNPIETIHFDSITPDKTNNWINLADDNDWEELTSIIDKSVKYDKNTEAIFKLYFSGVPTNRDEWVYDLEKNNLKNKMSFFSKTFNECVKNNFDNKIKWSRDLKGELNRGNKSIFKPNYIINAMYRTFCKKYQYTEKIFNDVLTQNHYDVLGQDFNKANQIICIPGVGIDRSYHCIALKYLPHLQITPNGHCFSIFVYDQEGNRHDNITDWGLNQFRTHYKDKKITKEDIFHYVYAVLHNPSYRKKYELNLKREFPRIPFYKDFRKWTAFGKELMHLHINYEEAEPYPLKVIVSKTNPPAAEESTRKKKEAQGVKEEEKIYAGKYKIKTKLKADKLNGIIEIDEITILKGIPKQAWEYKLGNRSALEWILDQYKEKKPKDPTIAEKFNTYRFADYKEHVLDLLKRVCTVSVKTMEIVGKMGEGIT
ncbi:MAG: hypothetical protein GX452_00425 [Ignavibacteriales bacterium]|nr:hypothetical protein [Ignavibacteriales bacterium]